MSAAATADAPRVPIPLRLQAECAQRELAMRHRVYPGRVKRQQMTEAEAASEIDTMRAIRDTLRLFAEHETAMRSALAKAIEAARFLDEAKDHPAVQTLRLAFPEAACSEVHALPGEGPGEGLNEGDRPMSTPTIDDLKACHFDLMLHINMGSSGHHHHFKCREHPRLTVSKFAQRKTRTVETTYCVDDEPCASLGDALQRLGSSAP